MRRFSLDTIYSEAEYVLFSLQLSHLKITGSGPVEISCNMINEDDRLQARNLFEQSIRRENFKIHIRHLYGEEVALLVRSFEKLRGKRAKLLSSLSFLMRCRDHGIIPKFATVKHFIKTTTVKKIMEKASHAIVKERICFTRRRLDVISEQLFYLHLKISAQMSTLSWNWVDGVTSTKADWMYKNASSRQRSKFDRLLPQKSSLQDFTSRRSVVNLTEKKLDEATLSVLGKGLNFAPTPRSPPLLSIVSGVEEAVRRLPSDAAEEIRRETCRALLKCPIQRSNISSAERAALRNLRDDPDIVTLKADKGNATVLLPKTLYFDKMYGMLSESTYRKIDRDPTGRVQRKICSLLNSSSLPQEVIKKLKPHGCVPSRLYGLPKVHKDGVPLRPIVSNIGAPTYDLSKYLASLLRPFVGKCAHHIRNSADFINKMRTLRLSSSDLLVSFDVVSLFTKVPLEDSLALIAEKFQEDITTLFRFALSSTYFMFNNEYFEQTDGVAMGNPLSPLVANLFMEDLEERALQSAALKPTVFWRYVDDTFIVWPHGKETLMQFLHHLNSIHENIRFTMELEKDGFLPFLDVLVQRKKDGSLGHSVYRKPTHTDLYLQSSSCHHPSQTMSVLKTLVHRAYTVSDQDSLPKELAHLKKVFMENGYSTKQINKAFAINTKNKELNIEESTTTKSLAFLPFVGNISFKIARILRNFEVKVIFRPPPKIVNLVGSVKDDLLLRKAGIYKIPCQCGMAYIGQTTRTVLERCTEHQRHTRLSQTNKSAIAEHCISTGHSMNYDKTIILATATSFWDSVIKESVEIRLAENLINRDSGYQLDKAWNPVISKINSNRRRQDAAGCIAEHNESSVPPTEALLPS